jgi:hypothetical protein
MPTSWAAAQASWTVAAHGGLAVFLVHAAAQPSDLRAGFIGAR